MGHRPQEQRIKRDGEVEENPPAAAESRNRSDDSSLTADRVEFPMNTPRLLKKTFEKEEHHRQLIAYEIHDGIAQYVAAAIMQLEAAKANPTRDCKIEDDPNVNEALRLLREASRETRHLISGLRPPTLDELGIIDSLETLVRNARLEIEDVILLHNIGTNRLPSQIEVLLFRIAQESLTNIRRHARAQHVRVELNKRENGSISLLIQDDGCGFDLESSTEDHFGLEGIRQRALYLGGTAEIQSKPGAGTTIHVQVSDSVIQNARC
ncbi:MAG TPA: hypothetical protein DEB70_12410 [Planctomycetaceae bacterium]|nr:hypothetical protein [Planctomycetaceae bacterium]